MAFAHFAVWYDLDTTRSDATKPTSGRQPRAQLQKDLGWVRSRAVSISQFRLWRVMVMTILEIAPPVHSVEERT